MYKGFSMFWTFRAIFWNCISQYVSGRNTYSSKYKKSKNRIGISLGVGKYPPS